MENFFDLLKERFSVELGRRNEGVLAKKNVFTTQCRVEILVKKVKRLVITSSFEDDLDCVLQVDSHFVGVEILLCLHCKAIFSALLS